MITGVISGVLALIGIIIAALFTFPPIVAYFQSTAIPAITPSSTLTFVPSLLPSATSDVAMPPPLVLDTETPATLPNTEMPSPTTTSTEGPAHKMNVVVHANLTTGKVPLPVNFNAKDSSVKFSDGSVAVCGQTSLCSFVWRVYREGKQIGDPVETDGIFSYTFGGKGIYLVTVYVCRKTTCNGDGITIETK